VIDLSYATPWKTFGTLMQRYLESRGREFTKEVTRKQSRQLGVTAFVDEDR
jgi:hypothetical protein